MKNFAGKIKGGFIALRKSGILTWVLLLALWQIASLFNSPDFLPGPITTILGAREIVVNGLLLQYFLISFQRILIGWALGIVIAVPLGLLIGSIKSVRQLLEPFINFFRFVPAIGFLTLFLMWFGVGEKSKIILPVIINTIAGVASIHPDRLHAAASLGASRFQIFYSVIIPASVPHIFTGVRLGLSGAIVSIISAEMLAAQEGIGYLIYTSRLYFRTDWIFTGIFVLGVMGYVSDRLLRLAGKKFLRHYGLAENKA
jgi:ABC-type nitrate/sulfonate/bicarbonate transport system permease component